MKQGNLFLPDTNWNAPQQLPDLTKATKIAIDLETNDPNLTKMGPGAIRGDGKIIGIAVAVDGWKGYLPIGHVAGNIDPGMVWRWFEENVVNTEATKIFHNAMYDVSWIAARGFKLKGKIVDTMIAASLINENRFSFTLDSVAKDYIKTGKDESVLRQAAKAFGVDPKSGMADLPAIYVGDYAERDAEATLKLWDALQKDISDQDLEDILKLETDLFPMLVDMTFKGVRVDLERAAEIKKDFITREKKILHNIKEKTGIDLDIWAASSIQKLFDKLKIDYDKTEKGAPSFTKNFMKHHSNDLVESIAVAREFNKAHTTFIDSIVKHEHKGRIHANINQLRSDAGGTVTGRFSYANPNLQQIPAKHKVIGPMIRSIFLPEEGCKWGCFDYAQQEPRILVHFAHAYTPPIPGVEEIVEKYHKGEADFHQMVADMANIERKQAKTINLGMMYGMGKNKLMGELGSTKEEAENIWKTYKQMVPFVHELSRKVSQRANNKGKIRTLAGRLCHFDMWEPHGFNVGKPLTYEDALSEYGPGMTKRAFTYKALNKLIQGSAADMTKKAMLALYREGVIPHIQIHDELDISVESVQHAEKIVKLMEEAIELQVPNKIDYEEGDTWGDIHG